VILRIIGNLSAESSGFASEINQEEVLELIHNVYSTSTFDIKKEITWIISNLAANSEEDAIKVAKSSIIFPIIMATNNRNYKMRKEAVWVLSNACHHISE